jgi:hypothetical protein
MQLAIAKIPIAIVAEIRRIPIIFYYVDHMRIQLIYVA